MTSFIPIENVQFSKRLTRIEQHASGVRLSFQDGTEADASFLAGADGIKSTVRAHVLGGLYPKQVAPVYVGAYCYRAVIPMSEAYEILGDLNNSIAVCSPRPRVLPFVPPPALCRWLVGVYMWDQMLDISIFFESSSTQAKGSGLLRV